MSNCVYISLNTIHKTFALGVFKTAEEAEKAYLEYLTTHENFESWFEMIKQAFKQEFGKELHTLDDFKASIFKDEESDYVDFWLDHNVGFAIEWPKKGELFWFYQWVDWINTCEDPNLYRLLDAILKGTFYKESTTYYARYHPILKLPK